MQTMRLNAVVLLMLLAASAAWAPRAVAQAPAPATPTATPAATPAADPARWGPYARLVGRTFAGEDLAGPPGYASQSRTVQWEVPGQAMRETGVQGSGAPLPDVRILPGDRPGELRFVLADAPAGVVPDGTGHFADAEAYELEVFPGVRNRVVLTGPDTYEMATLKDGAVLARAVYRETASAAHRARPVRTIDPQAALRQAVRDARRAQGVPAHQATPAPADRVLAFQEPVRGPAGTLRVTRAPAWLGECYAAVYINGRWAARLDEAESADFKVPAGAVRVEVAQDPQGRAGCRFGDAAPRVHETELARGESLHVYFSHGGARFHEAVLAPAPR